MALSLTFCLRFKARISSASIRAASRAAALLATLSSTDGFWREIHMIHMLQQKTKRRVDAKRVEH
jgi:hypothetical protein